MKNNIFHEGEYYIQEKMGVRNSSDSLSSIVKSTIPKIAKDFLENLNFSCITISTHNEDLHTFLVYGIDKFIKVINEREILVDLKNYSFIPDFLIDIRKINIAFIGLDFERKMRVRINGNGEFKNDILIININEIYSNCPKYISKKILSKKLKISTNKSIEIIPEIDYNLKKLISNLDTFFIASSHKEKGLDVSYKGGKKGFLKVKSKTQLEFDDLPGNNFFNSIGNIYTNPYINILIIDFENSITYHLKAKAKIMGDDILKITANCYEILINKNSFLLDYK